MSPSGSMSSTGIGGTGGTIGPGNFGFGGNSGEQIFKDINSLFGAMNGNMFGSSGGGGGGFGTTNPATQLQTGPNLTGDIYSGYPYLSGLGGNLYNFGSSLAGLTQPLMAGGLGLTGQGFGTVGQGVSALGAPQNYYQQLLSGNPSAVASAAGPYSGIVNQQMMNAINTANTTMPGGGQLASTRVNLPQAAASQVGNYELGLQPQAAQGLQGIAGLYGQLGGEQAGIGQGVSNLGLQSGQLGLQYGQAGMQGIAQALQNELQKQQLNYSQPSALQQVIGSIAALAGAAKNAASAYTTAGGGGCWIAEAIYGIDDFRTHLVRAYLNGPFRRHYIGRTMMSLYVRYGRRVAAQVRRHSWLKAAFRPLFDRALRRSIVWVSSETASTCAV